MKKLQEYIQKAQTKFEIPSFLVCKLTGQIMINPVLTPPGFSYEKEALEENYLNNKKKEPETGQIYEFNNVVSNTALKQACEDFLKKNPWAYEYRIGEDYKGIQFGEAKAK